MGTGGREFMTAVRSVAAILDDIRQSSIQHCSADEEGELVGGVYACK